MQPEPPTESPALTPAPAAEPAAPPDAPRRPSPAGPLGRTLSVTGLLLLGAFGGVAAVKFAAPHWLAPANATAFSLPHPAATLPSQPDIQIEKPQRPKPTPAPSTAPATPPGTPKSNPFVANPDNDPADARHTAVVEQLQNLRKQLDLYRAQHRGSSPQFTKYEAWYQLTNPTRVDGSPTPDGQFGPYLAAPPVNPLNGLGALGIARRLPKVGETLPGDPVGFVYCTANGAVLATDRDGHTIYDEYRVERETAERVTASGTPEEKQAYLADQLQTLRAQITLYKSHHNDLTPEFARYPLWEQLTRPTNADGAFVLRGHGPYLGLTPVNPHNGFSKVEIAARLTTNYRARGKQVGYVFETTTEKLYPTDPKGAVLRD